VTKPERCSSTCNLRKPNTSGRHRDISIEYERDFMEEGTCKLQETAVYLHAPMHARTISLRLLVSLLSPIRTHLACWYYVGWLSNGSIFMPTGQRICWAWYQRSVCTVNHFFYTTTTHYFFLLSVDMYSQLQECERQGASATERNAHDFVML
jgi:hypothetical protein